MRRASRETLTSPEHPSGPNNGAKALQSAGTDRQLEAWRFPAIISCSYQNRKFISAFTIGS